MFATIRRISRFASDAELAETIDVLESGGIVALPDRAGMLLIANVLPEEPQPETLGGQPAMQVAWSLEAMRKETSAPLRLLHWLDHLADRMPLELALPLPLRKGDTVAERGLVRVGCGTIIRRIAETGVFSLVASRPRNADGSVMKTAGEVLKHYRDNIDLAISLREEGGEPLHALRCTLMRAGLAYEGGLMPENVPPPLGVMFVCIGNLNRSALAEAMVRQACRADEAEARSAGMSYFPAYSPCSTGTIGMPGNQVPEGIVIAAESRGCGDFMQAHHPRRFSPELIGDVEELFPLDARVAETLRQYSLEGVSITFSKQQDLPDPMGEGLDSYYRTAEAVEAFLGRELLAPPMRSDRPGSGKRS